MKKLILSVATIAVALTLSGCDQEKFAASKKASIIVNGLSEGTPIGYIGNPADIGVAVGLPSTTQASFSGSIKATTTTDSECYVVDPGTEDNNYLKIVAGVDQADQISGKTITIYAWDSSPQSGFPEKGVAFYNIGCSTGSAEFKTTTTINGIKYVANGTVDERTVTLVN